LKKVKLPGRAKLLELLGKNLKILSFRILSPVKVFSIIETFCPNLRKLRVDKAITVEDLISYRNNNLVELELLRCTFVLPILYLPNLKRLRYSTSFRLEEIQIKNIFNNSAPKNIIELTIEVPSTLASITLLAISRNLIFLRHLSIETSNDISFLKKETLLKLGSRCVKLSSLQILSKSVNYLGFENEESFLTLGTHFKELKSIRIKCEDVTLNCISSILQVNKTIKKVFLWVRRNWVDESVWNEAELIINNLKILFPTVYIFLEEI
jgi:hypothetical protein